MYPAQQLYETLAETPPEREEMRSAFARFIEAHPIDRALAQTIGSELYHQAISEDKPAVARQLLRAGFIKASELVNGLLKQHPEAGKARDEAFSDAWTVLLAYGHINTVIESIEHINDYVVDSEIIFHFLQKSIELSEPESIEGFLDKQLFKVLLKNKQTCMMLLLVPLLEEKGMATSDIVKYSCGYCTCVTFEKLLSDYSELAEAFNNPYVKQMSLHFAAGCDNVGNIGKYIDSIENEDQYNAILISASENNAANVVVYLVKKMIAQGYAIDERCILINPHMAAYILQKGLRIRGGTLRKVASSEEAAKKVLASLVELAEADSDPVRELRIDVLTQPQKGYGYPVDERIIQLAQILEKDNVLTILDKNASTQSNAKLH